MSKILVFDIDGVLCPKLIGDGVDYSSLKPFPQAVETINKLFDAGYKIVFFTSRFMSRCNNNPREAHKRGYEFTLNQLKKWGIKFHELHMGKIKADKYIDDKSIFFQQDWKKIYEECTKE